MIHVSENTMPSSETLVTEYVQLFQKLYKLQVKVLKERLSQNNDLSNTQKIKVVFFVSLDCKFAAKPLFEKMLKDDLFEPLIVVVPLIIWGGEQKIYQLKESYTRLVNLYGSDYVFNSYCDARKSFIDVSSDVDIAVFENPYVNETYVEYTILYYAKKQILPIYINYGTMPDSHYAVKAIICSTLVNLCWKVFVGTKDNFDDFCKYAPLKGENVILSGHCKMDGLALIKRKKSDRKKIILAPHHTVDIDDTSSLPLSNFLTYSDLFLELPQKYPQIDFVFRPHPTLFIILSGIVLRGETGVIGWGKERVDDYIKKMSSFPNVEYQEGGDYFETFVNSDAIIHDCASFIMEYLYTGHPPLYLLRNKESIKEVFAPIGQKCLEHYYQAFNEQDIINFIEEVVLKGNDPLKEQRIKFAQEEIMVNYPHVSDFILQHIKDELTT